MPRALVVCFLLFAVRGYSQESSWASCKSFEECQTYVRSWQAWADENIPKCKAAMADAKNFDAEKSEMRDRYEALRFENEGLEHRRVEFNLLTAAVGIGIGIGAAFYLARGLRRFWRISARGKQLTFMVLGAFWMTGAAVIAVNQSDLTNHPVNLLATVLVYSLPGLLFGGIGFWWFGRPRQLEPTP